MSYISGCITEYESINNEIKRLSKLLKTLRLKQNKIKEDLAEYAKQNDSGLTYKDLEIKLITKDKAKKLKNKEKNENIISILKDYGVKNNLELILQDILNAGKGQFEEIETLSIKKIKNKK